jgi:uncharacterized protein YjiS (DUF1127 family)
VTVTALTHTPVWNRTVTDLPALLADWRVRRRYRAELRRLLRTGQHLLADIGLTPAAAAHEACLPFWR